MVLEDRGARMVTGTYIWEMKRDEDSGRFPERERRLHFLSLKLPRYPPSVLNLVNYAWLQDTRVGG